jgi:hypothetical protein
MFQGTLKLYAGVFIGHIVIAVAAVLKEGAARATSLRTACIFVMLRYPPRARNDCSTARLSHQVHVYSRHIAQRHNAESLFAGSWIDT